MRTSVPGSPDQVGLTLVEVLIVLGVMALMTAAVVVTVPPRASEAERAARDFARDVTAWSDEAVTRGRTVGLRAKDGLRLFAYEEDWTETRTLPLAEGLSVTLSPAGEVLPPDPLPKGTLLVYRPPGEEVPEPAPVPPVLFAPTGEVTPFEARFEDEREAWLVAVGPFGEAEVDRAPF